MCDLEKPEGFAAALEAAGVAAVFSPGTSIDTITDWLTTALEARERNMGAHA